MLVKKLQWRILQIRYENMRKEREEICMNSFELCRQIYVQRQWSRHHDRLDPRIVVSYNPHLIYDSPMALHDGRQNGHKQRRCRLSGSARRLRNAQNIREPMVKPYATAECTPSLGSLMVIVSLLRQPNELLEHALPLNKRDEPGTFVCHMYTNSLSDPEVLSMRLHAVTSELAVQCIWAARVKKYEEDQIKKERAARRASKRVQQPFRLSHSTMLQEARDAADRKDYEVESFDHCVDTSTTAHKCMGYIGHTPRVIRTNARGINEIHVADYSKDSQCSYPYSREHRQYDPRNRYGIPLPLRSSRSASSTVVGSYHGDDSVMVLLDSGAEQSVLKELALIPEPTNVSVALLSFMGDESVCPKSGYGSGMCRSYNDEMAGIELGYAGWQPSSDFGTSIVSVPDMMRRGAQFFFTEFPMMLTPDGHEIPLYASQNGTLYLRVHTKKDTPMIGAVNKPSRIHWVKSDLGLWHQRLCHLSNAVVAKTVNFVHGIPALTWMGRNKSDGKCLSCLVGKSHHQHIGPTKWANKGKMALDVKNLVGTDKGQKEYLPMQQFHMDCCKMDHADMEGRVWFLIIVDRCTDNWWFYPLHTLKEVSMIVDIFFFDVVQKYHSTHPASKASIKTIRTDSGSEFDNNDFVHVARKHDFTWTPVAAYVKDGRAEEAIKHLVSLIRTCLIEANLKPMFWSHFGETITHVRNRCYVTRIDSVPFLKLWGKKPDCSYFRQPGCVSLVHLEKTTKTQPQAKVVIFLGYDVPKRCWVFMNPTDGRKIRSVHATFYERRRDPHEHVDVSDMVLTSPKLETKDDGTFAKTGHWRCSLWPATHWTSGNDIVLPGDDVASDEWHPDSVPCHLDTSSKDVDFTLDRLREAEDSGDFNTPKSYVNDTSRFSCRFPTNRLSLNPASRTRVKYIADRLLKVDGRRVQDVVGKTMVQDAKGKECVYSYQDLHYDCNGKNPSLFSTPEPGSSDEDGSESDETEESSDDDTDDVIIDSQIAKSTTASEIDIAVPIDGIWYADSTKYYTFWVRMLLCLQQLMNEGSVGDATGTAQIKSMYSGFGTADILWQKFLAYAEFFKKLTDNPRNSVSDVAAPPALAMDHALVVSNKDVLILMLKLAIPFMLPNSPAASDRYHTYVKVDLSKFQRSCTARLAKVAQTTTKKRGTRRSTARCVDRRDVFPGVRAFASSSCSDEKCIQGPLCRIMYSNSSLYDKYQAVEFDAEESHSPASVDTNIVYGQEDKNPNITVSNTTWDQDAIGGDSIMQSGSFVMSSGFGDWVQEEGNTSTPYEWVERETGDKWSTPLHVPNLQNTCCVPSPEELVGYRPGGAFQAADTRIGRSYHIMRVQHCEREKVVDAVTAGRHFVVEPPKGMVQATDTKKFGPYWTTAIYKELNVLFGKGCFAFERMNHPDVHKHGMIPSHFVFAAKWSGNPAVFTKFKARLVASGDRERYEPKPYENYAQTASATTNRIFDAYATFRGFRNIRTTDMTAAFVNSVATQPYFVRLPRQFEPPGKCLRLLRMLYGLRSSPASWASTLSTALITDLGMTAFKDDSTLMRYVAKKGDKYTKLYQDIRHVRYTVVGRAAGCKNTETMRYGPSQVIRKSFDYGATKWIDPVILKTVNEPLCKPGDEVIAETFVDDVKWAGSNNPLLQHLINLLCAKFATSDEGGIDTYLGIHYSITEDIYGKMILHTDQTAYIDKMTERFELADTDLYPDRQNPLPSDLSGCDSDNSATLKRITEADTRWQKKFDYPVIIGSLIHAMVHSRGDIGFAVSVLSRRTSDPRPCDYKAARMVLTYLRTTRTLGTCYKQSRMLQRQDKGMLHAAVDSSFADCEDTARSTSGYVLWFGDSPIDWECKRQPLVSMSTFESEYIAASRCVLAIKYVKKVLEFFGVSPNRVPIAEDNSACVIVSQSVPGVIKARTKHIATRFHVVRESCQPGEGGVTPECELVQVWTGHQVGDIFTKPLAIDLFIRLRDVLMGYETWEDMVEKNPKPVPAVVGRVRSNSGGGNELRHDVSGSGTSVASQYVARDPGSWPSKCIPIEPPLDLNTVDVVWLCMAP